MLEDLSGRYDPAGWARAAINAYYRHSADRIVAEVNKGGDMVESTLRTVDANLSYTAVRASRGKFTRAEPVAALYEQGRVHHVGGFPELEDQMTGFVADLDRAKFGSPDQCRRIGVGTHGAVNSTRAVRRPFGILPLPIPRAGVPSKRSDPKWLMIGSMFSYGARVRELISAFAEATEAIMASDPRSRARVLGKRATHVKWV